MKVFVLFGIVVLLFAGIFTKTACGQVVESSSLCSSDKDGCDFSKYKRLKVLWAETQPTPVGNFVVDFNHYIWWINFAL